MEGNTASTYAAENAQSHFLSLFSAVPVRVYYMPSLEVDKIWIPPELFGELSAKNGSPVYQCEENDLVQMRPTITSSKSPSPSLYTFKVTKNTSDQVKSDVRATSVFINPLCDPIFHEKSDSDEANQSSSAEGNWQKEAVIYLPQSETGRLSPQSEQVAKFTFPDGSWYYGQVQSGKIYHGLGAYHNASDQSIYVGGFAGGEKDGRGRFLWYAGRNAGGKYEGEYKKGKRDGTGTETYPDGRVYLGEFKAGKKHGKGIVSECDGLNFRVEFDMGQRISSRLCDENIVTLEVRDNAVFISAENGGKNK